jgi:hypothetical protein
MIELALKTSIWKPGKKNCNLCFKPEEPQYRGSKEKEGGANAYSLSAE